jgi:hypothetical protein
MSKTFVRTTTCLAVSAAALIAVTTLDAIAARPRSPTAPETTAPKPAPKPPAPKPTEPPPKLTIQGGTLEGSRALPRVAPATTRSRADSELTIPNWKGKRLSVALREARKLGLNVSAVDESGEEVEADEASNYRVRGMLTKAGTTVEPGGEVEVRVREIVETAMGY